MSKTEWRAKFQERLETLRSRYGISKAEIARRSNIPARTLENYLKGQKPSVDALILIAEASNVDIGWLLDETTEKSGPQPDLVGEASWVVMDKMFQDMLSWSREGRELVVTDTIMGREPGELAAKIEARIVTEYLNLRDEYAFPSRDEARDIDFQRNRVAVLDRERPKQDGET